MGSFAVTAPVIHGTFVCIQAAKMSPDANANWAVFVSKYSQEKMMPEEMVTYFVSSL